MNPFSEKNIRLYGLFTICYNARAYYPVLAVLFVDLGLRLEDYSRLNALWAAAILLLEVPSGALADTFGRRKLVVFAAILMITEMALLLFAPINGGMLLISLCIGNRILSGVSEAAASGADQALAYDTLEAKGQAHLWEDKVMPVLMRWRSAAFVVSMLLGGFLYDPTLVNKMCGVIGFETSFTQDQTLRLPLLLVFLQGVVCLILALQMKEVDRKAGTQAPSLMEATKLTIKTLKWAFTTQKVALVIVGALLIDAFIRNYATVTSEYYREIQLPPATWGMMGAAAGLLGMVTPEFAKWLDRRFPAPIALSWVGIIALVALAGVGLTIPYWGLIPSILCMTTFTLFIFIADNNLHKYSQSSQRATILSVKGMALNLGYGLASLSFAQAVVYAKRPELAEGREESAFASVLSWQPWVFAVLLAAYITWALLYTRSQRKVSSSELAGP